MKSKKELVDDMRKLNNWPPYSFSLCYGDGYFHNALKRDIESSKYSWDDIREEAMSDFIKTKDMLI